MPSEIRPKMTRRFLVGTGAAAIGWAAVPPVDAFAAARGLPPVADDEIVITMIGTGSVVPNTLRYGNSTLVQAGGLKLLVDAGRGCAVRLTEAGMPMGKIDAFFLTHFHSDHVIGMPDLWMTGYLHPDFGTRKGAFRINGPTGTTNLCNAMRQAFRDDVRIREDDEHIPDADTQIQANEFPPEGGVVFEQNGVKVTAFEVNHGPLIKPACGYRFDYGGLAVTISGDTKFDENLIRHAAGSDLLVHEVALASDDLTADDQVVMNHHTSPEEAGTVFTRTNVRIGVFSHLVDLLEYEHDDATLVREIHRKVARTFNGRVLVPNDLGRIVVTKSAIEVQAFNETKGTWM